MVLFGNKCLPAFPVSYLSSRTLGMFRSIMGGAKKKSMAQMEKTQDQTDKKDEPKEKKGKTKGIIEKRPRGLQTPDISDPKFIAEVQKMGAITPFSIASQFNLRLSVAKDLLEDLEKRRLVRMVGGNARIRIYQPAAA
jgi:ribosomal protein S25